MPGKHLPVNAASYFSVVFVSLAIKMVAHDIFVTEFSGMMLNLVEFSCGVMGISEWRKNDKL